MATLLGCASSDPGPGGANGGSTSNAGQVGLGGTVGSGGQTSSGGTQSTQGGSPSSGGSNLSGGTGNSKGGAGTTGGAPPVGGAQSGGSVGLGGSPMGGSAGAGTGGAVGAGMGGGGGRAATGGVSNGGATGGAATGGAGGTRGPCQPPLSYRNLFSEFLSKTDAEVDAKLAAGYQALFHGTTDTVYYQSGSDEAYILDAANNDVRSEGISYGMMISVQLDKKEEFNRLWKFAKQHMAMSGGNAGLFNWKTNTSGQVTGNGSAPDGEEYFATALLFASKRWGDGSGIFAYSTEAKTVLDAMANKGLFNRSNNLVLFLQNSGYTDPSYMLPAFYEVWACADTKNQAFWKSATSAARSFFQKTCHSTTMLAPYLANFDGSRYSGGGTFQSDAWRVVGNIMMDHHLFNADPWQKTSFAPKFAAFFTQAWAMAPIPDEFTLEGSPTHTNAQPSKGLQAQNALVGFGLSAEEGTPFVKALWDMQIPAGQYRYYDGMLYMLSLLHVSGRFHLYY